MAKEKSNQTGSFIGGLAAGVIGALAINLGSGWVTTDAVRDM